MGYIVVEKDLCKGCELCVHFCPKDNIKMTSKFNRRGNHFSEMIDEENCTGCALCAKVCPDVAIKVWR